MTTWPPLVFIMAALSIAAAIEPRLIEYPIPSPGAFPYDTALDAAGRVYFTETAANRIGCFDPRSGRFAEFRVPSAASGPHGIVVDSDGIVSFTEIKANKIGRFDPVGAAFHEYPTGNALSPHTPVVAGDHELYFTAPGSDAIGRLDPASSMVATFAVPTPNASPSGIKLGPDRALYFTESGASAIGRFDLKSHLIAEYATPTAGSAPRRLWFWKDDAYFTEHAVGRIGRFDIRGHSIREWPSPGGPGSLPDGIAIDRRGQVWYDEAATGAIVDFDPSRETFGVISVTTRGAAAANMDLAPDGRVWMALGEADRLGVLSP